MPSIIFKVSGAALLRFEQARANDPEGKKTRSELLRILMEEYSHRILVKKDVVVAADVTKSNVIDAAEVICEKDPDLSVSVAEIMTYLGVPEKQRRGTAVRVGHELVQAGFKVFQPRRNGVQLRRYRRRKDYVSEILSYSRKHVEKL